ncbi:MAG: biopolymer transporter ExbD [Symploca sp. SIO1B1]|nr:biopolymer transporter ExbD [Symploca sp. SIO1C2]NER51382.1 biopolymer transporter ExbD [Symploca sp. SIO1A3]NER97071.1 biopolymer transporter ExbD [Symploca sp. SIO1B1]
MRLPDESDSPLEINIVPMIDLVFSILAFFIISTLYLTRSEGLPVNLPTATTAEVQRQSTINVTINPNGEIRANNQPVELPQLASRVSSMVVPNSGSLVIINADENVAHGQVVAVMDSLRQVQGVKLAIAAEKP